MANWFKKLWDAKIQINIIYPATEGIISTTEPRNVNPLVKVIRKSNYRFVKHVINKDSEQRVYYVTEEFKDNWWSQMSDTWKADKDEAMQLHLKVINGEQIKPPDEKIVLWEGLSKEETQSWAGLSIMNHSKEAK